MSQDNQKHSTWLKLVAEKLRIRVTAEETFEQTVPEKVFVNVMKQKFSCFQLLIMVSCQCFLSIYLTQVYKTKSLNNIYNNECFILFQT